MLIPAITLNRRHMQEEGWEVQLFKPKFIKSSIWCLPLKNSLLIKTWTRAMHWALSLTSAVAVSAEHSWDHPAYCTLTNYAFHRVRGLPVWLLQQLLLLFLGYPAEHSGDHLVLYTNTLHRVRGLPMLLCVIHWHITWAHKLFTGYSAI